jgi:hypothetical protein
MVSTVTIIPITAYLIVLIAGLIFSSFHPERIKRSHHHKIKTIDRTQDAKTNKEIASNTNSPNSICSVRIQEFCSIAYATSINMF